MMLAQLRMQAWMVAQQGTISAGVSGPNYQFAYQRSLQGTQASIYWQTQLANIGPTAQLGIGGTYSNGQQGQTIGAGIGIYNIPGICPINGGVTSVKFGVTTTPGPTPARNSTQINAGVIWQY
jgi:hypothetical protein